MSAITIGPCPKCLPGSKVPLKERHLHANSNCSECKGEGTVEIDKEKRWEEDLKNEAILDKVDAMEDAGIDWKKMSDEEFEKWTDENTPLGRIERFLWDNAKKMSTAGSTFSIIAPFILEHLQEIIELSKPRETDTPASISDPKRSYQCERCGGMGQQVAGLWDGTGYNSTAGTCTDCEGSGKLGPVSMPGPASDGKN